MTVRCDRCGQEWPRDPALEVPCPWCNAEVGKPCMRPSGHPTFGGVFHNDRDIEAMRQIPGYHKCPGNQQELDLGGTP